jgi:hypothetical protein
LERSNFRTGASLTAAPVFIERSLEKESLTYRLSAVSRRLLTHIALLVCFFVPAIAAHAQTGLCATFSASNFNTPNRDWQYGSSFGLYHDAWHLPFLGIGFDARAVLLGSDNTKAYSCYIGPHIQLHPHILPIRPYIEGLVGGGRVMVGEGNAAEDKAALAYEGVAGVKI